MSIFFNTGLNPLNTAIGYKIEQATDAFQESENWGLFMDICDLIYETEDGPRDAIKAFKKRLQQNAGKNYKTIMLTLTLLETCVKNCGEKFHVQVCSRDFVQELIKLIGPKNNPPEVVQDKVLSLIQSWNDAFRNIPECAPVVHMYRDLKMKGITFPMTDLDSMVPIHTPHKVIDNIPVELKKQKPYADDVRPSTSPPAQLQDMSSSLSPEQLAKLYSELDIVESNMSVLNELLNELTPGKEEPSDFQLLTDLYGTCKAMQARLMQLINQLDGGEITAELLRVNDLLNNLFLRYSRYEKNREAILSGNTSKSNLTVKEPVSLIDLSDDESKSAQQLADQVSSLAINKLDLLDGGASTSTISPSKPSASGISSTPHNGIPTVKSEPDFDMFAQSRNVTYESSKKAGSTYEDNLNPVQLSGLASATQSRSQPQSLDPVIGMHVESDFDEMAAWLGEGQPPEPDSLTSSEFDRFLAERAAAADNLQTVPCNSGSATQIQNSSSSGNNRRKSSPKDKNAAMLAL